MEHVIRLTDKNFEMEVLGSELPVLVEFWGSWCPPCKMMEPTLEQLAVDYGGRVKVGKLNVDQNPRMSAEYRIQGAPTFLIFSSGELRGRRIGAQSEVQLEKMLEESGAFAAAPEATEAQDEEQIRKHLQSLGYIE